MSLVIRETPSEWLNILQKDPDILTALRQREVGSPVEGLLDVSDPIPVYGLPHRQAAHEGLSGARRTGWRAVVCLGETPLAALDLVASGNRLKLTSVFRGELLAKMVSALERAGDLEAVRDRDFETRILDMPGIALEALWLFRLGEEASDLFLPWTADDGGMELNRDYDRRTFEELVMAKAKKQVALEDRIWNTKPATAKVAETARALSFSVGRFVRRGLRS